MIWNNRSSIWNNRFQCQCPFKDDTRADGEEGMDNEWFPYGLESEVHVTMNLPALAITFINVFKVSGRKIDYHAVNFSTLLFCILLYCTLMFCTVFYCNGT